MSKNRYIELINKEVDGLISVPEKQELDRYLDNDPSARTAYDETLRASEMLKQIPDINPSPNLKKYILNSIDPLKYESSDTTVPKKSLINRLFDNLNPKVAYAFTAGVIIGLIIYSVFLTNIVQNHTPDNSKFFGTIGVPNNVKVQKLEQVPVDIEGVTGIIGFYKYENELWLEIKISNADQVKMTFEFDQSALLFNNYKPLNQSKVNIENTSGTLFIGDSKDYHYVVMFQQISTDKTNISFRILKESKILYQYEFRSGF